MNYNFALQPIFLYFQEHIEFYHEGKRVKCKLCPLEFASSSGLQFHISSKHEEKIPCKICGELVSKVGGRMQIHIRVKHDKKLACSQCDQKFRTRSMLKDHQNIHLGLLPHTCKHCNMKFHFRWKLSNHEKNVHNRCRFNCRVPNCSKFFQSRTNYKTHIQTVHKNLSKAKLDAFLKEIPSLQPDLVEDIGEPILVLREKMKKGEI